MSGIKSGGNLELLKGRISVKSEKSNVTANYGNVIFHFKPRSSMKCYGESAEFPHYCACAEHVHMYIY